ncbi:hypothetical protein RhiJN_14528 [Ceratobasidium sp. AG-Ba]|nr:hypothetical protein RhiJN_14528 [Ceratobasidium sp. AG-Ba]
MEDERIQQDPPIDPPVTETNAPLASLEMGIYDDFNQLLGAEYFDSPNEDLLGLLGADELLLSSTPADLPIDLFDFEFAAQKYKICDMRKHVAKHILAVQLGVSDPSVMLPDLIGSMPCGYCRKTLVPDSSCPYRHKFTLRSAGNSTDTNPSTNRPLECHICKQQAVQNRQIDNDHVFWSYNMPEHIRTAHPTAAVSLESDFAKSFAISIDERQRLGLLGPQVTQTVRIASGSSRKKGTKPSQNTHPIGTTASESSAGSSSASPALQAGRSKRALSTTNSPDPQTIAQATSTSKRQRSRLSQAQP